MPTSIKPNIRFQHIFITTIPDILESNKLYISIPFNTVLHKCACGCGEEVSTPLSPSDWEISYNGESVTLEPSIGNWTYRCRSHYLIRNNQVVWASNWSQKQINESREFREQIRQNEHSNSAKKETPPEQVPKQKGLKQFFKRIFQ
jgi:hypothetical protein